MPRQAGLDAPNTLHQVMVRGIERTTVFRHDADRADFFGGGRLSCTRRPAGGRPRPGSGRSSWRTLARRHRLERPLIRDVASETAVW
jgi:hypothetical protein